MTPTEISNFYQMRKAHSKWSPLKLKPIAWYKGDGDAQDSSGNGYHGTWVGTEAYADGVAGQAFNFNGASGISTVGQTIIPAGPVTIVAWAKLDRYINYQAIAGAGILNAPVSGIGLTGYADQWEAQNRAGLAFDKASTNHDSTADWTHLATVRNGIVLRLYVNGVLSAETASTNAAAADVRFAIGQRYTAVGGSGFPLDGSVDDVLIFNRALTITEISELYLNTIKQGGQPWGTKNPQPMWEQWTPMALSPTAWYKGDGNALDSSGNGYHGTWVGTPAYADGVAGQGFLAPVPAVYGHKITAPGTGLSTNDVFSISLWARFDSEPTSDLTSRPFLGLCTEANSRGLGLFYVRGRTLKVTGRTATENSGITTRNIIMFPGIYHICVVSSGGGAISAFVNGLLSVSGMVPITEPSTVTLLQSATVGGTLFSMDGLIDDLMIFKDKVLTQSEITDIYVNSLKQVGHEWGPYMGFSLTVDSSTDSSFILPTTGNLNNVDNDYAWWVSWGDGKVTQEIGKGNRTGGSGIYHEYPEANTEYVIKIQPLNPKALGYLGAFGFNAATTGSGVQTNRDKVRVVDGQLTEQMIRVSEADSYVCAYWFQNCKGMRQMGPTFNLPQNITTVGSDFARGMFAGCVSTLFTMNDALTMPQSLLVAESQYAFQMFLGCSGESFRMGSSFNLSPMLSNLTNNFCAYAFQSCSGAGFVMSNIFNIPKASTGANEVCRAMFDGCRGNMFKIGAGFKLPETLSVIGTNFTISMFRGCYGLSFTTGVIQFMSTSTLSQTQVDKSGVLADIFQGCTNLTETISPATIPQLAVIPSVAKNTFTGCTKADLTNCYTEWGGAFDISTDYTKVEYLESTGTQYIDTGVIPSLYGVSATIDMMTLGSSKRVFGVRETIGGSDTMIRDYTSSSGMVSFVFGTTGYTSTTSLGSRYVVVIANKVVSYGGSPVITYAGVDRQFTIPIFLFAANESGSAQKGYARVYSAMLGSGGVVRDYVPVVRKSDDVAGFFDTVTQTLFTNQGTGVFTIKESYDLSVYRPVAYLESTGTQYIDTGIKPTVYGTDIATDILVPTANTRSFGVTETIGGTYQRYSLYSTSAPLMYLGAPVSYGTGVSLNTRFNLTVTGGVVSVNGSVKGNYTGVGDGIAFTTNMLLFCEMLQGTMTSGAARIYSFKMWQSSTLVRNLLPCVRRTDSVAGMYDTVSGNFLTNQGTGTFTVGEL